jgi:hypothetical protein
LLNKGKGHWEALIIELRSPNYAKVGAKMTNLEANKVDKPDDTNKGPNYGCCRDRKFIPILKYLFDKSPLGAQEEV